MSENLLDKARAHRDLVLLAELGGWLHDLGKLSSGFVLSKTDRAYSTAGETGAPPQAEEVETPAAKEPCKTKEEWVHGKVFAYDDERISKEKGLKAALERHLTGPGG